MLAKQPLRIERNRAYSLGIADDKGGVAIILHTIALLQKAGFKDYGQITVLINVDEEISSPGSRNMLTEFAASTMRCFPAKAPASPTTGYRWPLRASGR